jgi:hypothetical protein
MLAEIKYRMISLGIAGTKENRPKIDILTGSGDNTQAVFGMTSGLTVFSRTMKARILTMNGMYIRSN